MRTWFELSSPSSQLEKERERERWVADVLNLPLTTALFVLSSPFNIASCPPAEVALSQRSGHRL